MASVIPKGDGRWQGRLRVPDTSRPNAGMVQKSVMLAAPTRAAALRKAQAMEQALRDAPRSLSKGSFGAWAFGRYLDDLAIEAQPSTVVGARRGLHAASRLVDFAIPLVDVRADFLNRLRGRLATEAKVDGSGGYAPRTQRTIWARTKAAVGAAYAAGLCPWSPYGQGKALRPPETETRRVGPQLHRATWDDTLALAEALGRFNHTAAAALVFCAATGLRRGEVLAVAFGDLDEAARVLHVRRTIVEGDRSWFLREGGKTEGATRTVPLSAPAMEVAARQRVWHAEMRLLSGGLWNDAGLLFPHPVSGEPWRPAYFGRTVGMAARKAGLTPGLHSRRHGFATQALRAGALDLDALRRVLGHSTIGQTTEYVAWAEQDAAAAADRLDAMFGTKT